MINRTLRYALIVAATVALSIPARPTAALVIDFDDIPAGTPVTDAELPAGFTIGVDNLHARHPDAAIIYDTSCAAGQCSGDDDDLRTPGVGIGNDTAQENMLIIATDVRDMDPIDGLVDDPDDEQAGGTIGLGFPEPAILRSLRIVDIDVNEPGGFLELFLTGGGTSVVPIPALGNNSAQTLEIPDAPLVDGLVISLYSSGAVDDIVIDEEEPSGGGDEPRRECPGPNREICNNGLDDDDDGRIDCNDQDCPEGVVTCGENGEDVPPCTRVRRDPATIRFHTNKTGADYLKVHGRFALQSAMSPDLDGFTVLLTNAHGVIFRGTLAEGELRPKRGGKGRYVFKDRRARGGGLGDADNLFRVSLRERTIDGEPYAVFRVKAYGDLSAAIEPVMALQVIVGDDVAVLEAAWRERARGWELRLRDFR